MIWADNFSNSLPLFDDAQWSFLCRRQCDRIGRFILDNFSKPQATINLSESPTFLGNFSKGVKIFNFSSEIIFGQLYRHLAIFYWSHWWWKIMGRLFVKEAFAVFLSKRRRTKIAHIWAVVVAQWQSGRFLRQRSAVRIQSLANFYNQDIYLFTVSCMEKRQLLYVVVCVWASGQPSGIQCDQIWQFLKAPRFKAQRRKNIFQVVIVKVADD